MIAVIFEVRPMATGMDPYLETARELRDFLQDRDGFVSVERFQSLTEEGKLLSLSFWRDEACVEEWRNLLEHRLAQKKGKKALFSSYRIRVAEVLRDYTDVERSQAPADSNASLA